MVNFRGSYYAADQIKAIVLGESGDAEYPYLLSIVFKGDDTPSYRIKYKTEKHCNDDAQALARRIESEQRDPMERIYTKLYLLEDMSKRIDRRQLRIWRILKALLSIDDGGVENE